MNKKKWLLIGVIVVLVLFATFFFLKKEKEETKETPKTKEEIVKQETEIDQKQRILYEKIEPAMLEQGFGGVVESHAYTSKYFLTANEKNGRTEAAFINSVVWSELKDGKIKSTLLTKEEGVYGLVKEKRNAFIKSGTDTLIVFYEKDQGIPNLTGKTYVYKITGSGTVKEVFKAKGSYGGIKKDKNGNLIILEKIYDDPLGRYPMDLKPYELHYRKYTKEKWDTIQVEHIEPIETLEKSK